MIKQISWLLAGAAVALLVITLFTMRSNLVPVKGEEMLLLCGGSLRDPMEKLKAAYEKTSPDRILLTFGDSGSLCAQIQNSGKGDLYLCHDPFMPWAVRQGLITDSIPLAMLNVVIAVPKGNPKQIAGLKDLARPGLRIGIGDQTYSTSGQISKHLLTQMPYGAAVLANVIMETKGHQQRCNDVILGSLDVTLVWDAVARLYPDKLEILPIPEMDGLDAITSATYKESNLRDVQVTLGIIKGAERRECVRRFFEYARGNSREAFAQTGFTPAGK